MRKVRKAQGAKITPLDQDPTFIKDGLENLIAGLGLGQKSDKRAYGQFQNTKQLSLDGNQTELNALYRTDWVAGKVVDIVPEDMTREWRKFDDAELTPEDVKKLEEEEERIGLQNAFKQGHKWGRLYGTGFIIMDIDDGFDDPMVPVNIERLEPGCLRHIKVVDRHRVQRSDSVENNPLDPNFGMPEWYRLQETDVRIHHSRVIRFDAVTLPYDELRRNNYWSDSVLDRLYESILNFNTAAGATASMINEATVDIIKIKNFMSHLQTKQGEELLRKRFTLAGIMKSMNHALLLDTDEEFEQKTNTFSGLGDLISKYEGILVAATDIPAGRFLGALPGSLNTTGEGDMKNYYDMIKSKQVADYKPKLDYVDQIMAKSIGLESENLAYSFNSLFQMTDSEKASIELSNAQRDALYVDREVIPASTAAKQLQQDKTYSEIDDAWIKELEELEGEPDEPTSSGSSFGNLAPSGTEEEEEIPENQAGAPGQGAEEN